MVKVFYRLRGDVFKLNDMETIYADTWGNLTTKMLGYYHDHCYHLYTGLVSKLPKKYSKFKDSTYKYVFIYKEDKILN